MRGMTGPSLQYSYNQHRPAVPQGDLLHCLTAYFPGFPLSIGYHCCGPLSQPVRQLEAQVPLSKKKPNFNQEGVLKGPWEPRVQVMG